MEPREFGKYEETSVSDSARARVEETFTNGSHDNRSGSGDLSQPRGLAPFATGLRRADYKRVLFTQGGDFGVETPVYEDGHHHPHRQEIGFDSDEEDGWQELDFSDEFSGVHTLAAVDRRAGGCSRHLAQVERSASSRVIHPCRDEGRRCHVKVDHSGFF
jgi:hypothetical protein